MLSREDYIAFLNRVKQKPYYPYVVSVLRASVGYGIYALMSIVTVFLFYMYFYPMAADYIAHTETIGRIIEFLLLILMLNTVILSFSIYNEIDREDFLKTAFSHPYCIKREMKQILSSSVFWFELLALCLLFAVFPLNLLFDRLLDVVPSFKQSLTPLGKHAIFVAIFGVLSFLLMLHSRLDVRKLWLKNEATQDKRTKMWLPINHQKKNLYRPWKLWLRLLGYAFLYIASIRLATFVLVFLLNWVGIVKFLAFTPVFLFVFLLIPIVIYIRAFNSRRKFIKMLKECCRKNRFELVGCKHPYRSIFRDDPSYTFAVTANGVTYYCRILASVMVANQMFLDDKGFCTRRWSCKAFHYSSLVDYRFEADGKKILIINPVPKKIFRTEYDHPFEADNGDKIGEYLLYTGPAFLRGLERNVIDRIERDPYKWI